MFNLSLLLNSYNIKFLNIQFYLFLIIYISHLDPIQYIVNLTKTSVKQLN